MGLIQTGLGIASDILGKCGEEKAKAIVDAISDALPNWLAMLKQHRKSRSFGSGIFLSEKRMLPACPTQPAASKRTENGCSCRWYGKNDKRLRISAKRYILCYLSVAFYLFFVYYSLVTGNINHPVSPNVCGGIGNLTKGVNGLCCMALWN